MLSPLLFILIKYKGRSQGGIVLANNIKGKRILQKDNISKNEIIDVSSLPSGLYLVDVNNTEGHREVIKLVKR